MDLRKRGHPWAVAGDVYPELVRNVMDVGKTLRDRRNSGKEVFFYGMHIFFELVEGRHLAWSWLRASRDSRLQ